jgi:hypothetical protein
MLGVRRLVASRSFFTMANTSQSNVCGRRDHVYGNEEGHDIKNEVRKEKWIRKRNPRTGGENWRRQAGYEPDPLTHGTFAQMSDWSETDTGHLGAPTEKQKIEKVRMIELAQSIYDAAMLVEKAKAIK